MGRQTPIYTAEVLTKEEFFYAYKHQAHEHGEHLLLESGRDGNLCIAGINPLAELSAGEGDSLHIKWRDGTREVRIGEPLELLTSFVHSYEIESIPELPEFQGGVAGFISYDYVRRYEKLSVVAEDGLKTPDLFFYLFDEWAILDVKTETAYFITLPGSGDPVEWREDKWMASAMRD